MQFLVGIDDMGNAESGGTEEFARAFSKSIAASGLGVVEGITAHQLLVDDTVSRAKGNTSFCLSVSLRRGGPIHLIVLCREFVRSNAAKGSNAGFCVAPLASIDEGVLEFGRRAKTIVLEAEAVHKATLENNIYFEEVAGDGRGIIGALAAVALRADGNDGLFVWLPGLEKLEGVNAADELLKVPDAEIRTLDGELVSGEAKVDVGTKPRPVLKNQKVVYLVEKADSGLVEWRMVSGEEKPVSVG